MNSGIADRGQFSGLGAPSLSREKVQASSHHITSPGQALPYATLMYVRQKHHASGSVVINSRTDRTRKLVAKSGPQQLARWLDDERDSMRTTKSVSR
ncbi:MAG: DUF3047 domain-containing protein [Polaromonas sp.]|nr:DUF3047 domain-containing protein [Polaromonas sp.]